MKNFFSELKRRNVVRVSIAYVVLSWVLIQAADILLPTFGAPEGFQQGFFILLGLLFPLVLFFSWAFEITPEGVKKTKDVDQSKSVTHGTGQKINKMIAVGLVIALGFIVYDQFFSGERPMHQAEAANASIAVLPFVNMSSDPEQEYFSDGISEELLNLLAKIPELQVAGRTSSFAFKGQNQDLREVGKTLDVSFLLEGSVRKQGNNVRITAQLIRSSDGIHLWSETYDRTLDDIFEVQDEISASIVGELQTRILGNISAPVAQAQKVDPEAHTLYLLGLQKQNQDASQPYLDAREYYRHALDLSPDYIDALWGLGFVTADLVGFGTINDAEARAGINEALGRLNALGVGDDPRALILQAELLHLDGNHDRENELKIAAYAANPNDTRIVAEASVAYANGNNNEKAIEILKKGLLRDPLNLTLLRNLSRTVPSDEEAEAIVRKMLEIDPDYTEGTAQLAFIYLRAGKFSEALRNMQRVRELDPIDPDVPVLIAAFLIYSGFVDEAETYLDKADAMSPNEVASIGPRAYVLAARGDNNTAGILAETLLLSNRTQRLNSDTFAMIAAEKAFTETGQFERLQNLVLSMEPNLNRPLETLRQDGDSDRTLLAMIGNTDELARAWMGLGRDDEARALLEKSLEIFKDINPDWDTTANSVTHYSLLGQFDEVVKRLKRPENLFTAVRYIYDPGLSWRTKPMKDHPGFKALKADIEAKMAPELEKVRVWLDSQKSQ